MGEWGSGGVERVERVERRRVLHTYRAVLSTATLTRTSVPNQAISFTSLFLDYFSL